VCAFYVEFGAVPGGESGSWELRDAGGTAVADGSYDVTGSAGDRQPDSGTFTFPNGTYTLLWDDEDRIDNSNEELEIVVECVDESEPPVPTETPMATPTFEQSVAAETDAPSFVQSVAGETDAPEMTLPDTTALTQPARPDPGAWAGVLAVMLGLAGLALTLAPKRRPRGR
jgi:hypothetical protein